MTREQNSETFSGHLPLSGIRVLDFTQIGAGPYATSMLGDFGADVIKVEPPTGDPLRYADTLFGHGSSAFFFGVNRSKRAMVLDLSLTEGRAVLDRLVDTVDVVIVSMRPEAIHKNGLDFERLKSLNERLIYCSITAFGEDGPLSNDPGMDILAQARGGIMGITGEPDGPPTRVGPPITDWFASYTACFGIMLSLRSRDVTGTGQKISINLLDGAVSLLPHFTTAYFRSGVTYRPMGGAHPQIVPYQVFKAADGYMVVACLTEKFWPRMCRAIEREGLATDERFMINEDRVRNRDVLIEKLIDIFAAESVNHWMNRLRLEDVPCSPVNMFEDVFQDPQVLNNEMLLTLNHPIHGKIQTVNNPVHLSATPAQPFGYPPNLGEHTDSILEEIGMSNEDIARLRKAAIIR